MASDFGRHNADENAIDRARIDYLAGDPNSVDPTSTDSPVAGPDSARSDLTDADRAELDELRELLADPTLWSEPPPELEDSVVALITAEAAANGPSTGAQVEQFPFVRGAAAEPTAVRDAGNPAAASTDDAKPIDRPAVKSIAPNSTGMHSTGMHSTDLGSTDLDGAAPIDLGAARQAKQERSARRRFTRPAFLIGAAAALVAVALSAVVIMRDSTPQRRFDVALSATELVPGATGSATMLKTTSGWEIQLDATGLPRLDGGQFYEAWLKNADGVLVPIGTFNEGTDVTLWSGVSPDAFATMTITRESADGEQNSSGQKVLAGNAVETTS